MTKTPKKSGPSKTKRFTKQRQAILEILNSTYSHPDANWIYKQVSKDMPSISLGTIYRNLNILCKDRLIREISFQPNVTRYDPEIKPHNHIMCNKCHKVEDIHHPSACPIDKNSIKKLTGNFKYTNISCEILFTGICPDCQSTNK